VVQWWLLCGFLHGESHSPSILSFDLAEPGFLVGHEKGEEGTARWKRTAAAEMRERFASLAFGGGSPRK